MGWRDLDTEFPWLPAQVLPQARAPLFPQQKSARAAQSLAPHLALTLSSDMAMATVNQQEAFWRPKDPGPWPGTSPALKGPREAGASHRESFCSGMLCVSRQEEAGADAAGWAQQADRRGGGSQLPYQALNYSGSRCSRVASEEPACPSPHSAAAATGFSVPTQDPAWHRALHFPPWRCSRNCVLNLEQKSSWLDFDATPSTH